MAMEQKTKKNIEARFFRNWAEIKLMQSVDKEYFRPLRSIYLICFVVVDACRLIGVKETFTAIVDSYSKKASP